MTDRDAKMMLELADEIEAARNEHLNSFGLSPCVVASAREKVRRLLHDDVYTIITALRATAAAPVAGRAEPVALEIANAPIDRNSTVRAGLYCPDLEIPAVARRIYEAEDGDKTPWESLFDAERREYERLAIAAISAPSLPTQPPREDEVTWQDIAARAVDVPAQGAQGARCSICDETIASERCDDCPQTNAWHIAIDIAEKNILSEYYSGRLNGDQRIRVEFRNLRSALSTPSTGRESDPQSDAISALKNWNG